MQSNQNFTTAHFFRQPSAILSINIIFKKKNKANLIDKYTFVVYNACGNKINLLGDYDGLKKD